MPTSDLEHSKPPDSQRFLGLQFADGLLSVFRGLGTIIGSPAAWPYAMVPTVVLVVLGAVFGWVLSDLVLAWAQTLAQSSAAWFTWLDAELHWVLAAPAGWLLHAVLFLVRIAGATLAIALGFVVAFLVAPPLSAPALEKLVRQQEETLQIAPRQEMSFWAEMLCGIKAQLVAGLCAGPLLFLLWLISVVFPAAVIVTTPLELLIVSLAMAWNLFDYPLTLRGVSMRARWRFLRSHPWPVLGFGSGFALLFWVPCFGVIMLPVGVVAATRLVWELIRARPPEAAPWLAEAARSKPLTD